MRGLTLTPARLETIAARFKVLSEPTRLLVLNALKAGPLHVNALVEATGLNQANLSRHLQVLHAHRFVARRREGLFVYYEIADDSVFTLCEVVCGPVESGGRLAARR
jgi:DNA-binding transcriptional ArsR family regulator